MFIDFPSPDEWINGLINGPIKNSSRSDEEAEFSVLTYKSGNPVYYFLYRIWNKVEIYRYTLRTPLGVNIEEKIDNNFGIDKRIVSKTDTLDFFDLSEEYLNEFFINLTNKVTDIALSGLKIGKKYNKLLELLKQFPKELFDNIEDKKRRIIFVNFFKIIELKSEKEIAEFSEMLDYYGYQYIIKHLIDFSLKFVRDSDYLTLSHLIVRLNERDFKKMIDKYIPEYHNSDYFLQNVLYHLDGWCPPRRVQSKIVVAESHPKVDFEDGVNFLIYVLKMNLDKRMDLQMDKIFFYLDRILRKNLYEVKNKNQIITILSLYRLNSRDKGTTAILKRVLKKLERDQK